MSKDYNLFALGVMPNFYQTDEEVIESFRTFPKKLLHKADMNLWITWIVYLNNKKCNYEALQNSDFDGAGERWLSSFLAEKDDQGKSKYTKEQAMKKAADYQAEEELMNHIGTMQISIPVRHWHEMEVPYNNSEDPEPDWYVDYENVKSASYYCYRNNPQEYAGFIQADKGISLGVQTDGKWELSPSDDYWKTDESIERYRKHLGYVNTSGLNQADAYHVAFDLLKINFGENNLPPWSDKIIDWFKLYK